MAATLPIPLEFALPEGWQPAPPDEVGAPGVAFVALHLGSQDSFTANITISGESRHDEAGLATVADESVERLQQAAQVRVAERVETGSTKAPGLTQVLNVTTTLKGKPLDLVQCQVYLAMPDVEEPRKKAIIELALTGTPGQFNSVLGDFQQFVRTVRPGGSATS